MALGPHHMSPVTGTNFVVCSRERYKFMFHHFGCVSFHNSSEIYGEIQHRLRVTAFVTPNANSLLSVHWEVAKITFDSTTLFVALRTSFNEHAKIMLVSGRGHSLQWPIRGGSARKSSFFRLQVYKRVGISSFEVYIRDLGIWQGL